MNHDNSKNQDDKEDWMCEDSPKIKKVSRLNRSFSTRKRRHNEPRAVAEQSFVRSIRSVVKSYEELKKHNTSEYLNRMENDLSQMCSLIAEKASLLTSEGAMQLFDEMHKANEEVYSLLSSFISLLVETCCVQRFSVHSYHVLLFLMANEPFLCYYIVSDCKQFHSMLKYSYNKFSELSQSWNKCHTGELDTEQTNIITCILALFKVLSQYHTCDFYQHLIEQTQVCSQVFQSLFMYIASDKNIGFQKYALAILANIASYNNSSHNRLQFQTKVVDQLPEGLRANLYKAFLQSLSSKDVNDVLYSLTCLSSLTLRSKKDMSGSAAKMAVQLGERLFNNQNIQQTFQLDFRLISSMLDPFEETAVTLPILPIRRQQGFYAIHMLRCFMSHSHTSELLSKYDNLQPNVAKIIQHLSTTTDICPSVVNYLTILKELISNKSIRPKVLAQLKQRNDNGMVLCSLIQNLARIISHYLIDAFGVCNRSSVILLEIGIGIIEFMVLLYEILVSDRAVLQKVDHQIQEISSSLFKWIDVCARNLIASQAKVEALSFSSRLTTKLQNNFLVVILSLAKHIITHSSKSSKRQFQIDNAERVKQISSESISSQNTSVALASTSLLLEMDAMEEDELINTLRVPGFMEMMATVFTRRVTKSGLGCYDRRLDVLNALACIHFLGEQNMHEFVHHVLILQQLSGIDTSSVLDIGQEQQQIMDTAGTTINAIEERICFEKQIEQLTNMNSHMKKELANLERKNEQSLQHYQTRNRDILLELEKMKNTNAELKMKLEQCQTEVSHRNDKLEETYQKLILLTSLHKRLVVEWETSTTTNKKLEGKLNQEKAASVDMEKKFAKMEERCHVLAQNEQGYRKQIGELESCLKELKQELDHQKQQKLDVCVQLNASIDSLKSQMCGMKGELEAKSVELSNYVRLQSLLHLLTGSSPTSQQIQKLTKEFGVEDPS